MKLTGANMTIHIENNHRSAVQFGAVSSFHQVETAAVYLGERRSDCFQQRGGLTAHFCPGVESGVPSAEIRS